MSATLHISHITEVDSGVSDAIANGGVQSLSEDDDDVAGWSGVVADAVGVKTVSEEELEVRMLTTPPHADLGRCVMMSSSSSSDLQVTTSISELDMLLSLQHESESLSLSDTSVNTTSFSRGRAGAKNVLLLAAGFTAWVWCFPALAFTSVVVGSWSDLRMLVAPLDGENEGMDR